MEDTPVVSRLYCPGCEVDADPLAEILDVLWCEAHKPLTNGTDDGLVIPESYLSGSGEAGGEDNQKWNDLIYRKKVLLRPQP